jgi:RNA polymerase sigma-70 factor (ECF subfamily)
VTKSGIRRGAGSVHQPMSIIAATVPAPCRVATQSRALLRQSSTLIGVDISALSDEDLLERIARERDTGAFEMLYQRYSRAIYSVVRRSLSDHGRSEDVVQEAFASVWRAAAGYRRERGSASGWLFAIARNAAADALRARRTTTVAEAPDQADPAAGPEERTAAELEAFAVHAAVDTLPDRERAVIELAYFSGLSQSEVADRLSLPLGTVKTRTRSGLARLAELLSQERVAL